jgi:hypothetical protein
MVAIVDMNGPNSTNSNNQSREGADLKGESIDVT